MLDGFYSAFITTSDDVYSLSGIPAVGDVCSYLISPNVFPPFDSGKTEVYFKVRYKTDEAVGAFAFYLDPFHATLKTSQGSVDLLTITTDGIFWSEDGEVETEVVDEWTGRELDSPPQLPPFESGDRELFLVETHTLGVSSEVPLKGCEPVQVRFQVCDWWDTAIDSGAFIDDVVIEFEKARRAHDCPAIVFESIAQPPAPRE